MNTDTITLPSRERYSTHAEEIVSLLDARINQVYLEVQQQPFWKALLDPSTPLPTISAILRELFLSIYWYQRHTTEAGFHMIGRLPKNESTLLKLTILHKVEEAGHAEWALRDYLLLGGNEATVARPPSPATFAVAGVWWRMATVENPFGYFGAEYLFEYLTMIVTQQLVPVFQNRGLNASGLGFIIDHATEDEKHTKLVRHLIMDAVTRHPESGTEMIQCFDYFHQVYPLPVWTEAYHRAIGA